MISDTLADAGEEIRHYLEDPVLSAFYSNDLRPKIVECLTEMEELRTALDAREWATVRVLARDAGSVPPQAESK